jgi:hypothetical protein
MAARVPLIFPPALRCRTLTGMKELTIWQLRSRIAKAARLRQHPLAAVSPVTGERA